MKKQKNEAVICPECSHIAIKYGHNRIGTQVFLCKQKNNHNNQKNKQFTLLEVKRTLSAILQHLLDVAMYNALIVTYDRRSSPSKDKELQGYEYTFLQYLALFGLEQILLAKIFNIGQSTVSKKTSEVYTLRQASIRPKNASVIKKDVFLTNVIEKTKGNIFKKKDWEKKKDELYNRLMKLEESYFNKEQ